MKTFVRFAVAGALLAAAQASFAQSAPASSGDLWLFVSDPTANVTFAEDTGYSLLSLLPTAGDTSGANVSTDPVANTQSSAGSIDLAASTALSSFISTYGASNLEWAVGGGNQASNTKPNAAGNRVVVASAAPTSGNLSNIATTVMNPSFQGTITGYSNDEGYLASSYTTGGKSYAWNAGTSLGNVWGAGGYGNTGGSTDVYGLGILQDGNGLGSTVSLFGMTGNGTTTAVQSYDLTDDLTLTANGTLEVAASTPPAVPVPAAVWLFGSGLLGLMGVGRRRAA